ncbi:hypothetical protein [Nonomuraea sp. NPDC049480]|uniref:hypothetical protein n=1 Tax=Nonomuraea sp. NPDC049480 TaxID=3364353 RepID=UPI0037978FDE
MTRASRAASMTSAVIRSTPSLSFITQDQPQAAAVVEVADLIKGAGGEPGFPGALVASVSCRFL